MGCRRELLDKIILGVDKREIEDPLIIEAIQMQHY